MRLTRASFYALHAMWYMAGQKNNRPIASHHIAQECGIEAERFLLKVLKPLVGAQILISIKGPNGGYRLARAANTINLLEIVEAVDGPIRGQVPVDPDDSNPTLQKRLGEICDNAAEQIRKQLKKNKLSDLLGKSAKG